MKNNTDFYRDELATDGVGSIIHPFETPSVAAPKFNYTLFNDTYGSSVDETCEHGRTIKEQPKKCALIIELLQLAYAESNKATQSFTLKQSNLLKNGLNGHKVNHNTLADALTILKSVELFEKTTKPKVFKLAHWALPLFDGESEQVVNEPVKPVKKPKLAKALIRPTVARTFTEAECEFLQGITTNKNQLQHIKLIITLIETNMGKSKGVMMSVRALEDILGCSKSTAHRLLKLICPKLLICTSKHYDEQERIGRKYRLSDNFKCVNVFATFKQ